MAIRQKAMSLNLIPSLPNLLDDLGGMIETNIPFDRQLGFVQLGYNLTASSIITSSIDSTMIIPAALPDGSEGLKLNMKVAKPMIDSFFGWTDSSSGSDAPGAAEAGMTARPTAKAMLTAPTPSAVHRKTP